MNARRPAVMIVDHFQNTEPDIYQAQPGDRAAHKTLLQHMLDRWPSGQEAFLKPVVSPRQDQQDHPQAHAEQNIDQEEKTLQPDRRLGVFFGRLEP
jgi:hypothetical protein